MNDRYTMLAALKGSAIKCLIVFCWEQRQMTVTEICTKVGHDDSTVRAAMRQLALYGLAAPVLSSQETWHLTSKGFQLPLPMNQLATGGNFSSEEKISPLPTTTTTLNSDLSLRSSSSSNNSAPGENSSSPQIPGGDEITENLATLHSRGVMGQKANKIARLDWVTPDYINAHVDQVIKDGDRLGLAIRRMEDGDPAPVIIPESVPKEWSEIAHWSDERRATDEARPPMSEEMQAAVDLWARTLDELKLQLTSATFNTWLGRASVVSRNDGTLVVGVHNRYAVDWLTNRLAGMVNRALASQAGSDVKVQFVVRN